MFGVPTDILVLALAVLLDLAVRELPNRFHPTAWIGKTIAFVEKLAPEGQSAQLVYGFLIQAVFQKPA